jgi:hypothetical protein
MPKYIFKYVLQKFYNWKMKSKNTEGGMVFDTFFYICRNF